MSMRLIGLLLAATILPSTAFAQPGAGAEGAEIVETGRTARDWAITFSPVHLAIGPIVELTGEHRFGPKLGAALMLGGGTYSNDTNGNSFSVFEAGASARYYALGDFASGLQVGASAEFVTLSGDNVNGTNVSAVANGLSLSPFLGYKHTWGMGLTFDGQVGPAFVAVRAAGTDGSTEQGSQVSVNLNLNLGWSF